MIRLTSALLLALGVWAAVALNPTPADASRCIRIMRQGNIETLVNTCDTCLVATLTRSRPGNAVPVGREYNILAKSRFPVPFRGPGRTRVESEYPCPGTPGGQKDLLKQQQASNVSKPEKCVSIQSAQGVGVVLVNSCTECRAVALERFNTLQGPHNRDYMIVSGRNRVPVKSKGFREVALLGDISCPKN